MSESKMILYSPQGNGATVWSSEQPDLEIAFGINEKREMIFNFNTFGMKGQLKLILWKMF